MLTMLLLAASLTPPPGQDSFQVEASVMGQARDARRVVIAGNYQTLEEAATRAAQVADQGVCELTEDVNIAALCWPAHSIKVVAVRRIH